MLTLVSEITFIKNKATVGVEGVNSVLSNNFNIPYIYGEIDADVFSSLYKQGCDVSITFNYVNKVEISESFYKLNKTAKITFPRNVDFGGLNLMRGSSPVFGRGDRVIIKLGYISDDGTINTLKEVFRGYISRVGLTTPLEIECEDLSFLLKQMKCKFPDSPFDVPGKNGYTSNKKITIINLLQRLFFGELGNRFLTAEQQVFDFNAEPNTETHKNSDGLIPVIMPIGLDTMPFSFNTTTEKSIAEVLHELHKKLLLISYFDDFGNLHIELPFMNSQLLPTFKQFDYENQIISDSNMKFQRQDEINLKVRFESKQTSKNAKAPIYANGPNKSTVGYIGSSIGDTITVNAPEDMSQADCDKYGLMVYTANTYTGYAKGSSFETFGEPSVYMGGGIELYSSVYPEKSGKFEVVGVKRTFGLNGYRQNIEIGIQVGTTVFDSSQ